MSGKISAEWHKKATENAEEKIENFINSIIRKAEAVSARDGDGIVTQNNVDEAMSEIKKGYKNSIFIAKAGLFITSLLTGIFVPNFFSQLTRLIELANLDQPTDATHSAIVAYFIFSLITIGLSIWLLIRDES